MAPPVYDHEEKRVLNPHGRRHYRRSYSTREVGAGALVLAALAAVACWVAWRGAHPDPSLFAQTDDLLQPAASAPIGDAVKRRPSDGPAATGVPASASGGAPATVARGDLPESLAPRGWTEARPAVFGEENLYEKIDGRASYFTSRGFERLSFLSLAGPAGASIDLELYDLGDAANALSAYAGEKAAEVDSRPHAGGVSHVDRNALYLTQGRYYLRAIGSDETEATRAALEAVGARVREAHAGAVEELPWAHRAFAALGVDAGQVEFRESGAFSFGFAKDVYVGVAADESEVFAALAADPAAAAELAARFVDGFASYGEVEGEGADRWVKDRYLAAYSTARATGPLVYGVRGAPTRAAATELLERLGAELAAADVSDPSEPPAAAATAPVDEY